MVADFGQAHLSNDATPALGTFFYMAPEQADLGHKIPDTRWDVYGLGALFYAMLTGEPPRKDVNLSGELSGTVELDHRLRRYRQGIADTPPPTAHRRVAGMDKRLAAIVDGCLELDPKKRLSSAESILNALEKRRVRKRQVPLLIYGIAAPLAVILLMALAGWGLIFPVIGDVQNALEDKILDGDRVTAQLLANGMQLGLTYRVKALQTLLKGEGGEKLRDLIAKERSLRDGGADLTNVRKEINDWLADASGASTNESNSKVFAYFSGLLAADADGYIITNGRWVQGEQGSWHMSPTSKALWVEDKSWRDWFSGWGNQTPGKHYPPVSAPHISQPFVSKEKDRGVVICISVPVKGADGEVIGLLTGVMTWNEFGKWNENVKITDGKVVVFNQRGEALKHQSQGQDGADQNDVVAAIKRAGDGNPPAFAKELAAQLQPDKGDQGVCATFDDPFQADKGGQRLAGYQFFVPNADGLDNKGPLGGEVGSDRRASEGQGIGASEQPASIHVPRRFVDADRGRRSHRRRLAGVDLVVAARGAVKQWLSWKHVLRRMSPRPGGARCRRVWKSRSAARPAPKVGPPIGTVSSRASTPPCSGRTASCGCRRRLEPRPTMNPIYYKAVENDDFTMAPNERFVIGGTTFSLFDGSVPTIEADSAQARVDGNDLQSAGTPQGPVRRRRPADGSAGRAAGNHPLFTQRRGIGTARRSGAARRHRRRPGSRHRHLPRRTNRRNPR